MYAMAGSQFVIKAMTAMDYFGVPFKWEFVRADQLRERVPGPQKTVPVLVDADGEYIGDSHAIFEWLEHTYSEEKHKTLYPAAEQCQSRGEFADAQEAELWCADTLYTFGLYFSWVDQEAFDNSIGAFIRRKFKVLLCLCCCCVTVPKLVGGARRRVEKRVRAKLGEQVETREAAMQGLVEQLQKVERQFLDDDQEWVMGSPAPTAADFAIFGVVERLVGDCGEFQLPAALPDLFAHSNTPRLANWLERIRTLTPITYKRPAQA